MPFIGNKPSAVPLTSADIADSIITSAKIVDGTIVNADINASAGVVFTKLASTGTLTVDNIQFPATAVASANANNLDDYEEGTFTPIADTGATTTFTAQQGYYTKIGRTVTINLRLKINLIGTSGGFIVQGLPFLVKNESPDMNPALSMGFWENLNTNTIAIFPVIDDNTNRIIFGLKGTSGDSVSFPVSVLKNSTEVNISGTYTT
jgi:hypothetical protein